MAGAGTDSLAVSRWSRIHFPVESFRKLALSVSQIYKCRITVAIFLNRNISVRGPQDGLDRCEQTKVSVAEHLQIGDD